MDLIAPQKRLAERFGGHIRRFDERCQTFLNELLDSDDEEEEDDDNDDAEDIDGDVEKVLSSLR